MRPLSLLLAAVTAAPLAAQAPPAAPPARQAPAGIPGLTATIGGWQARFDRPTADSSLKIAPMGSGTHFTTSMRGSAIAWQENRNARGNFTADLDVNATTNSSHAEGYGLILGGQDLAGDNQQYLYFLVNKDGKFLINHRAGSAVHPIVAWTANSAVAADHNVLRVEAGADSVRFLVNGQRVHALARSAAPVDGIAGLRINHGLSLHVNRFDVRQQAR